MNIQKDKDCRLIEWVSQV